MPEPQVLETQVLPAKETSQVTTLASSVEKEVVAVPEIENLITRASKVKIEPKIQVATNEFGLTKEDYDKVQNDPTLSKFYKSMQSDYIKKTQGVSDIKKQLDEQIKASANWTPERVQGLLNDPNFVQAASQVAATRNPPNSGLTDQEFSTLTDKEKTQITNMQQQLSQMQLQNWQMQQKQQDEQLKTKYANYAPDIVDTTVQNLVSGKVQANREYVWKAIDYNDAVNRAYQLGLQDREATIQEKQQSSSLSGFNTTPTNDVPPINQGESNVAYFKRIANRRLEEAKGRNK